MRRVLLAATSAILLLLPALVWAQSINSVGVFPTTAPVGVATPVRVTATITDAGVIPASILVQRIDAAGRVVGTVASMTDDGSNGDVTAGDQVFTARPSVYELAAGTVRLRVSAAFQGRLTRVVSAPVSIAVSGAGATVQITQPGHSAYLNVSPTQVRGTVGDPNGALVINGIPATVNSDKTFTAQVPLQEGTNTLTAVFTNSNQAVSTASVQVTVDTTPPHVHIDTPETAFETSASAISVAGLVNDLVVGTVNALQATVKVNGLTAQVANRSFLATTVPLTLGLNTIQAVATDRSGNSQTTSVQVTRVPVTGGAITIVGGNNQTAPAGTVLGKPLVVKVLNALKQPVANQAVVFRVVENSGGLVSGSGRVGLVAVPTDALGQAAVQLQVGLRSGVGTNVVDATATGFDGTAVFLASGTPTAATQIVVDTGNSQTGVIGQTLPVPFIAIVTDAGFNRLANVPVTFTVKQGGGTINGKLAFTTPSDGDGRVGALLKLGLQEGFDNNVVEASFTGNAGQPAAFLASAKVPGDPGLTSITGVVLDNSNHPIEGVTLRLFRTHQGTGLPEQVVEAVETDEGGTFAIKPAPVGAFKLMADGSTAPNGPWPTLEFDIVTIAGQANDVGLPIYLPKLDDTTALCVSETQGGTLTLPQVPGFALTIAAGAATFPGGARSGCVTVTPVNADKVPMAPGFGQQPRFVVTIQPVGTIFNPPAAITLPNVDGLAPRAVTEMYSYDHDLAAFVAIGTGTVSEDGAVIASDPGVGVIKAGWHCGGNPNTVGSAGTCKTCEKCVGTDCVPDNGQTPPQSSPTDCKKEVCQGGAVTTQNNDGEQPTDVCERCSSGSPVDRSDGSTPADSDACCFQGERLDKLGQTIGNIFEGPLENKCPQRTQNTSESHQIDGCSGGVPPWDFQNPMLDAYGSNMYNIPGTSTAFGAPVPGLTIPNAGAAGPQPCNQHDICYQTCAAPGVSISDARKACDDGMLSGMENVCAAAFPSSCPFSGLEILKCPDYHLQRLDCYTFANAYWVGLRAAGFFAAYKGRQEAYCKCCP